MKRYLIRVAVFCFNMVLKLRYRIEYKGLDESLRDGSKGILFLSNHPAILIDGLVATLPLLKACGVRPLIIESMFFSSLSAPILKWIGALPVPDFGMGSNSLKVYRLNKVLQDVSQGLMKGDNFLIYPAGMTKQTGKEVLGGSFAVHDILQTNPECPVVMIRIVGLWGSRFSRAQHKGRPVDWAGALQTSMWDLVKGLLFFLPRRRVEVTLERVVDLPRKAPTVEMNRWLESWFNSPFVQVGQKGEPISLVSYSPWKNDVPDIAEIDWKTNAHVQPEMKEIVVQWIADTLHIAKDTITLNDHLVADLGLDSLSIAELITYVSSRCATQRILPQDLSTVASLCLAMQGEGLSPKAPPKKWDTSFWFQKRARVRCFIRAGSTIPDLFFQQADRYRLSCAVADPLHGPLSYRQLKQAIQVLAFHIQKQIPGKRVGILLPDVTAAHLLVLACHIAGKTPVMLNWTVGARHLQSVVECTNMQAVLSSWSFVDALENVDLSPIQDKLIFLEEFKTSFDLLPSLYISLLSFFNSRLSKKLFPHWKDLREDDEAVLLFTSGTESEPKGVPLTHANILSNLEDATEALCIYTTDRLMSILPPFHSFGFTVTGLLPLLSGIPVWYYPNPTDGATIFEKMRDWKTSLICSAPSFLKNILIHAKKEPLAHLRLVVTGAEKAPDELFALASVTAPNAHICEGYGITECSPVLTVNTTQDRTQGVGVPLHHVRICIVDPEDFSRSRASGEDGMILASGPNIFSGYLQKNLKSPFVELHGTRWYITGDLGYLTSAGALVLTGRLKRFVKIGGEMISLLSVEEGLKDLYADTVEDEGPSYALVALEEAGSTPKLVLVTKKKISEADANFELRRKGFSNLIRIDRSVEVPEIPLTGIGKVSIHALTALAQRG